VTEIAIALGRPALTPEVRAWLNNRPGSRRPVLARDRGVGLGGAVLLRLDVDAASEGEIQDEVESLLTDLRMLGLRPKLLPREVL
jgi:hypothetical protein